MVSRYDVHVLAAELGAERDLVGVFSNSFERLKARRERTDFWTINRGLQVSRTLPYSLAEKRATVLC